jgi:membrane-bound lytic murein transglycosylase MltF
MSAIQWRPLIQYVIKDVWPQLPNGALWIEAQVETESGGRPDADSGAAGAIGLLQLTQAAADDVGTVDRTDPEENLRGGVRYLRIQHEHLAEIPGPLDGDRLLWAFASYNGGRGYINRALHLARIDGDPDWWHWERGSFWLMNGACVVAGRRPDYQQIWTYVQRIRSYKAHPAEAA